MNLEEIQQAASENAELQQGLINLIQEAEYGKEFLTNYAKVQVNEQIGTRIGELHGQYDKDILEASGIEKNQGEKSYDYAKRVIADTKANNDSEALRVELENMKAQYEELKQDGNGSEFMKNQLEAYKQQAEKAEQDRESAIKEKGEFENNIKVQMEVDRGMNNIKLKTGLPDYARDRIENVKESIKSKARLVEGIVVYVDEDGKPLIDNNFKNITAEELLRKELGADLIDTGKKQEGGGSKSEGGIVKEGDVVSVDVSAAKTQMEAMEIVDQVLVAQGIAKSDDRYVQITNATYEKIKNLPMR